MADNSDLNLKDTYTIEMLLSATWSLWTRQETLSSTVICVSVWQLYLLFLIYDHLCITCLAYIFPSP